MDTFHNLETQASPLANTHTAYPNPWVLSFFHNTSPSDIPHSLFIFIVYCQSYQLNVSFIRTRIFACFVSHLLSAQMSIWHRIESKNNCWICLKIHESRIWPLYHHLTIPPTLVTQCKMVQRLSSFVKKNFQHIIKQHEWKHFYGKSGCMSSSQKQHFLFLCERMVYNTVLNVTLFTFAFTRVIFRSIDFSW